MRVGRTRLLIGSTVLIGLIAVTVGSLELWLSVKHNQFRKIGNSIDRVCATLPGVEGAEDIAVDWQARQAFVSAKGARGASGVDPKRGLYRIDLTSMTVENVTPDELVDSIRPHGISLDADLGGQRRLFVVHHAPAREEILVFDVDPKGNLVQRNRITSDLMYNANDVAAVGGGRFYVTNSTRLKPLFQSWFGKRYVLMGWDRSGTILFFDGKTMRTVVSGLAYANGIAASLDKRRLYVSETFAGRISSFARDPTNGLAFVARTAVLGGPDNISVTPDGNLVVAAFPHQLEDVEYSSNMVAERPPAQLVLVRPTGHDFEVSPLWTHDGTRLTGVSVGAPFTGKMGNYSLLIGTIHDDHMLVCRPVDRQARRS